MTIVGCRIDGRLIHGQVANLWAGKLNVSRIMVVDDEVVNNPSVDVNYSDAATGARQIKLLGLAGTYVQMLAENVPTMRTPPMRVRALPSV